MVTLINGMIAHLGDKNLIYEHYSRDRVHSAEAKVGWVAADQKALPDDFYREG